jgi:hypothetical protein
MEDTHKDPPQGDHLSSTAVEGAKAKRPWKYWGVEASYIGSLWSKHRPVIVPAPRLYPIDKRLMFGRFSPGSEVPDICLEDVRVSRRHGELLFNDKGELVVHLFEPSYPTKLSGSPLENDEIRAIKHGAVLQMGFYSLLTFRVCFENPVLDFVSKVWAMAVSNKHRPR